MATDFSGIGGAVNSIFGGVGGLMQAGAYGQAADLAEKNAAIETLSTGIKLEQKTREGYQIIGATEAAAGANNLSLSGSAMDVLRSNRQQIALEHALTSEQGQIDINAWKEKAAADRGMAQAAEIGGIGDIVGGVIGLFSDADLKYVFATDGELAPGINIYLFQFKHNFQMLRGVIAQEVQRARPEAVSFHPSGYLRVNYEMLGLRGMSNA